MKLISSTVAVVCALFSVSSYAFVTSGTSVPAKPAAHPHLASGDTPPLDDCLHVTNTTKAYPGSYVNASFQIENTCSQKQAADGLMLGLDISKDSASQADITTVSFNSVSDDFPDKNYPKNFNPTKNVKVSNAGQTLSVLLSDSALNNQGGKLTLSVGLSLKHNLKSNDIMTLLNGMISRKDFSFNSLKSIPVTLTVNDGPVPSGFLRVAYPAAYPVVSLQWNKDGKGWTTLENRTFTDWNQNWVVHGLPLGQYRLTGETLTFSNGATFEPSKNMIDMALEPYTATQAISYQQKTDATGAFSVTMPAKPTGSLPDTVSAILVNSTTGKIVGSVTNLKWGAKTTVTNLAPSQSFALKFPPIYYVDGNKLDEDQLSAPLTVKPSQGANINVSNKITEVPSKTANFILQLPRTSTPSNALSADINISGQLKGVTLSIHEPVVADGASHAVLIPSTGSFDYNVSNIASDGGYFIANTASGVVQPVNTIALSYFTIPTVSGWPTDHVDMGNLTLNTGAGTSTADPEGLKARSKAIDAVFKYAGSGGNGDPGKLIYPGKSSGTAEDNDNGPTYKTIQIAQGVTQAKGHPVIPVMVVYTAQMSGGTSFDDFSNQDYLNKHMTNLAMTSKTLAEGVSSGMVSGGSIVLNPDLFGMIVQNHLDDQIATAFKDVDVTKAVKLAVCTTDKNPSSQSNYESDFSACEQDAGSVTTPTFANSLSGWVAANNWLIAHYGGSKVSFGWMFNIWSAIGGKGGSGPACATASATWLHYANTPADVKACYSGPNLATIQRYGLYAGGANDPKPNYIAFDKYEKDVVPGGIGLGYLFNQHDWDNYFEAIQNISNGLNPDGGIPVMLFQTPGGHMIAANDLDQRKDHISTAPDYIFGDDLLKSDLSGAINVNNYLNTALTNTTYNCTAHNACTVQSYLTYGGQDWTQPHLSQLLKTHVFAILWGGGTGPTTSIAKYPTDDGGWLAGKIETYLSGNHS